MAAEYTYRVSAWWTSGRTGLHVFVPVLRQLDYDRTRSACETIGRFLLKSHPKEITMDFISMMNKDLIGAMRRGIRD